MKKFLLIAFVFAWLFWAVFAAAGTYYCSNSTNSTDWNAAQSISTPCSLNTTMVNASAGDTVYFRGGNYLAPATESTGYTPAVRPTNSGTTGNLIIFQAYSDEIPFIDNTNNQGKAGGTVGSFGVYYNDYIVWDGFHTKVVPDDANLGKGILLYNADYITIRNCCVEGNLLGNSNNSCIRIDYVDNSTIENNRLYNSQDAGGADVNSNAFEEYHTDNVTFQNNDIWDCDCGIYDKQDGNNNIHRYNHIRDCNNGIVFGTVAQATAGTLVYQNVIQNIGNAIMIQDADTSGCDGFKFYNNTFYDVGSWGISLREATKVTNVEIFNNITYTATTGVRTYTGVALIIDYNDYYSVTKWNIDSYGGTDYTSLAAWQAGTGFDMNSTTSNPNFVNVGGTTPEDYKLQAGSPALTLGIDRQDYDGDGNTTEVIPAGAYIDGDETIGYSAAGGNGGNGGTSTGSRASGLTF